MGGGEWNCEDVLVKFAMAGGPTGETDKIAKTTPAEEGPG